MTIFCSFMFSRLGWFRFARLCFFAVGMVLFCSLVLGVWPFLFFFWLEEWKQIDILVSLVNGPNISSYKTIYLFILGVKVELA